MLRKHIKIEPMRWYYHCDRLGMLVWQDMLGMVDGLSPKFVKHYAELGAAMRQAFQTYADEVRAGTFPATEHTYGMDEKDLEKLY